ncbi:MAG: hypothetical protein MSA56_00390 [Clostridium sp.]|nr:hypothetical protein [Clostridium sp.]
MSFIEKVKKDILKNLGLNEEEYVITRVSTDYAVLKELKTGRIEKIRY